MDFYNNEIGTQIGQYVASQSGSTQDVINLVDSVMQNSLPGDSASGVTWVQQGDAWVASSATSLTLPNGRIIGPMVVSEIDPNVWTYSNPVDDQTGELISSDNANWPSGSWGGNFNYIGAQAAITYTDDNHQIVQNPITAISDALESGAVTFQEMIGLINSTGDTYMQGLIAQGMQRAENNCFGSQVMIDMWPLDPQFTPDPNNLGKVFDQDAVRGKVWKKPIWQMKVGDWVVAFDKNDNLVPGYVPRTMTNDVKILLNFHGTEVTPGHVYYRPDSKRPDKFETLIDVLRDDGVIQKQNGSLVRAATNVPVGDPLDGFVKALTGTRKSDGTVDIKQQGRIRLGTRFIVYNGKERKSYAVADLIKAGGGVVGDEELIYVSDAVPMAFHWEFDDTLPKPEDYVLECSGTSLEAIYEAAEWEEGQYPQMPPPDAVQAQSDQHDLTESAEPEDLSMGQKPKSLN